jgi:hypothetical protein
MGLFLIDKKQGMMDYIQIIEQLELNKTIFKNIQSFSNQPGIYAIYFHNDVFPDTKLSITKGDLIYIGKTEASQQSRDANTHFRSGKTGSSTLRRTIGALLHEEFDLVPVPRNTKDIQKKRITFFKFVDPSEVKLTSWMKNNLSLSFYEYPKPPAAIDYLETQLINLAKPIFNLSKNSTNPHGAYIKAQRKACGLIAHKQSTNSYNETKTTAIENVPLWTEGKFSPKAYFGSSDNRSNPYNKYKLHEAMEIVLRDCPNRIATFNYISEQIRKGGLYKQKEGGPAPPSQIRLRAKNYGQFEIVGNKVKLI